MAGVANVQGLQGRYFHYIHDLLQSLRVRLIGPTVLQKRYQVKQVADAGLFQLGNSKELPFIGKNPQLQAVSFQFFQCFRNSRIKTGHVAYGFAVKPDVSVQEQALVITKEPGQML